MNLKGSYSSQRSHHRQKGALLLVALIMVLLMTVIGMAAIRGTGLQESMAGNMREHNIAFQAAESALRAGEKVISPANKTLPPADGTAGLYLDLNSVPSSAVSYWPASKWLQNGVEAPINVPDMTQAPRYVMEEVFVPPDLLAAEEGSAIDVGGRQVIGVPTPFRISGKGFGIANESDVVLQSIFKRRQ